MERLGEIANGQFFGKDEADAQIISPLNGIASRGSLANCKQGNNNNNASALNGKLN